MRLSKRQLEDMLPGQTLTARCVDAAEWESAKRIAQRVKKECARPDGENYMVSQDARALTVSVETTNGASEGRAP